MSGVLQKQRKKEGFQSEFLSNNTTETTLLQVSPNMSLVMENRRRTL